MAKKTVYEIDAQLAVKLKEAKANAEAAKQAVIAVESEIWVATEKVLGQKIPDKGTTHATGVSIETGFNDKWDQAKLAALEAEWAKKSNLPFPFKKELKAIAKDIEYFRENVPDLYKLITDALTRTPAKPSFSLAE